MPYLTQLPDICRRAVARFGTPVELWPGWETRGRSGDQPYAAGRPWCVMWHHTASSDQTLEDYHAEQSDNAPVCNLDIKSDGAVVIIAAGPTNTNGKGSGTRTTSKGVVPVDSMNSYAVGIEFYNNGVGQPWPQIQIDVGFAVIAGIQQAYGLAPTDLFTHEGYAPDRKIDPATASAVQGPWRPSSCTSSGTWNDDDLRAENARRFGGEPEPKGDDVHPVICSRGMGSLDMFATSEDPKTRGHLMHQWWAHGELEGHWSGWEDLGGILVGPPTAIGSAVSPGRIDIFGVGQDGTIWQWVWDPTGDSPGWLGPMPSIGPVP